MFLAHRLVINYTTRDAAAATDISATDVLTTDVKIEIAYKLNVHSVKFG